MLKSMKKLSNDVFSLELILEGKDYQRALSNYLDYIPDYLQNSFNNELFPKGQTPIVVNEELHGDSIYRYILEAEFHDLYLDAVIKANIERPVLKEVDFVSFSKEQVVLNIKVESIGNTTLESIRRIVANGAVDADSQETFKEELSKISNVDKLMINPSVKRDEHFWKDLQDVCIIYEQRLSEELMPFLNEIGAVHFRGGAIHIDSNDSNPMRFMYPIMEVSLFPSAVFATALREYIPDFTQEDEQNLQKYILSCANKILSVGDQLGNKRKKILCDRLQEYSIACQNETLCGYSLYGQFGMDYDGLKDWTKNHQVKCAHILCDHIIFIKNFKSLATLEDLQLLKPIAEKNTQQDLDKLMKLFEKLHTSASSIFMTVRGALNGSRKIKWKEKGLCQYCGREFKKTLFGTKCPACKIKKDY